jgi:hypothetical protein
MPRRAGPAEWIMRPARASTRQNRAARASNGRSGGEAVTQHGQMGNHGVGVAGGDQFLGGGSVEAGRRLVAAASATMRITWPGRAWTLGRWECG